MNAYGNQKIFLKTKQKMKMSCKTEVAVESYLHDQIGRRLAEDRLSSGDIATDREDSPLQSKRSSMSSKLFSYISHLALHIISAF